MTRSRGQLGAEVLPSWIRAPKQKPGGNGEGPPGDFGNKGHPIAFGDGQHEARKASGRGRLACEAQPDTPTAGGGYQDAWRVGADRKGDPVNSGQPRLSGLLLSGKLLRAGCSIVRNFEGQLLNPAIIKIK